MKKRNLQIGKCDICGIQHHVDFLIIDEENEECVCLECMRDIEDKKLNETLKKEGYVVANVIKGVK